MPCTIHLESRGDVLARGMSWPLRTSDVAAAFSSRSEGEIWLSVWRTDEVKNWARAERAARSMAGIKLVECEYSGRWVEWKVDSEKRHSSRFLESPAWYGLDDPPLISCSVKSLPARVMREAGLTKVSAAATLARAIATLGPAMGERITARDWRVTLLLDANEKRLISRLEHRPTQRWTLVREEFTSLDAQE